MTSELIYVGRWYELHHHTLFFCARYTEPARFWAGHCAWMNIEFI